MRGQILNRQFFHTLAPSAHTNGRSDLAFPYLRLDVEWCVRGRRFVVCAPVRPWLDPSIAGDVARPLRIQCPGTDVSRDCARRTPVTYLCGRSRSAAIP